MTIAIMYNEKRESERARSKLNDRLLKTFVLYREGAGVESFAHSSTAQNGVGVAPSSSLRGVFSNEMYK